MKVSYKCSAHVKIDQNKNKQTNKKKTPQPISEIFSKSSKHVDIDSKYFGSVFVKYPGCGSCLFILNIVISFIETLCLFLIACS